MGIAWKVVILSKHYLLNIIFVQLALLSLLLDIFEASNVCCYTCWFFGSLDAGLCHSFIIDIIKIIIWKPI